MLLAQLKLGFNEYIQPPPGIASPVHPTPTSLIRSGVSPSEAIQRPPAQGPLKAKDPIILHYYIHVRYSFSSSRLALPVLRRRQRPKRGISVIKCNQSPRIYPSYPYQGILFLISSSLSSDIPKAIQSTTVTNEIHLVSQFSSTRNHNPSGNMTQITHPHRFMYPSPDRRHLRARHPNSPADILSVPDPSPHHCSSSCKRTMINCQPCHDGPIS
ncbi:hypothetical protein M440DRAFT_295043 [Trichoderma longibrachiatum ATCC 18648]|uniref:Uncharacterized protein n=1 Tax=Trichoderma longibrachiatum ATCC 18648 TaxID=983965 RepID=A0A2T4C8J7_TRILO|nr:hypothetical protein M440DRAFT_295043 [Trichoderma longibrachiatum ATCC 18648]